MTDDRALAAALCRLVAEPVVPGGLADRVARAHGRRRRRRAVATTAAAALGTGAVVLAGPLLRAAPGPQPPAAATSPATPATSPARPAVPGPYVAATGTVVARRGEPVRFCQGGIGRPMFAWSPPPSPSSPEVPDCSGGVTVRGADLAALAERETHDGHVWGRAWLKGAFADRTLTVVEQGPPREEPPSDSHQAVRAVPCAEPPGGWRGDEPVPGPDGISADGHQQYEQPSLRLAQRYAADNPGEVVGLRYGIPRSDTSVVVVAVLDVARAEAALRPEYGNRICIVRSRWTKERLATARAEVAEFLKTRPWGVGGGVGSVASPDGQETVPLTALAMTPELARFLAGQPEGMFRPDLWLRPAP